MVQETKKRIAFILPLVDNLNPNPAAIGISDYGQKIIQHISAYYTEILVLAHTTSGETTTSVQTIGNKSIKVVRCWEPKSPKDVRFLSSLIKTLLGLVKAVVSEGADHIHLEYDSSHAYGGTLGEPLIISLVVIKVIFRKSTSVTSHCVWTASDIRKYVAENTGSQLLSQLYAIYYLAAMKILFAAANSVITLTMHQNSKATETMQTYAGNKVLEVVHGVEEKTSLPSAENNCRFTALAFGAIRPGKDFETALLAFSELLKYTVKEKPLLVIAGSPGSSPKQNFASSYVEQLKTSCRRLNIAENVRFDIRHLPQPEVDKLFATSDVLLLLYKRRVGPSGIFAQAVGFRLPSIINADDKYATKTSPLPTILISENQPELTAKAIAQAMRKIYTDNAFRQQLIAGMKQYSQAYSYCNAAAKYREVFENHRQPPAKRK